jgi:hypothetical protein
MSAGRLTDEEMERRLEELRARIAHYPRGKKPPKRAEIHWISYIAAAVVFVALLIIRDFINRPQQASLIALAGAAAAFCAVNLILWVIRKNQVR